MSSRKKNNNKNQKKKKRVIRATILVDPDKPKVDIRDIAPLLEAAGVEVTENRPDLAIVVGGDGVFSYYGRIKSIPLLFWASPSRTVRRRPRPTSRRPTSRDWRTHSVR